MNLLRNTKAYLIGPIEQSNDPVGWRKRITHSLNEMGVKVYDPMVKPDWAPPLASEANKNQFLKIMNDVLDRHITESDVNHYEAFNWIRDVDLRYVHSSDFIVCYLPKIFSMGSGEELTIAATAKKPILIWSDGDLVPSSWLCSMLCQTSDSITDVFFKNEKSVIEYLQLVDRNEVAVDPMKWIFLSYFYPELKKKEKHA